MGTSTSTSTLAVGASRTFNLSPGSALTLVAPPNVRATVTETPNTVSASGVGGNAPRTHNLQLGQTVTYGPYEMGGAVVVANASNSGGAITWVRSDSIVAESASGAASLVSGDGIPFIPGAAGGDGVIDTYGSTAFDWCRVHTISGHSIGTTALTHSITNERPRWSTYTRKCALSNNTAEIRFASLPLGIIADPTDPAFSVAIYIESMPSEFLGASNPYIAVQLSNTTSLGSNFSKWTFNAEFLRQGWNILTMRQSDTISSDSVTAGEGNLPTGVIHPADTGTGFNWASDLRFCSIAPSNMDTQTIHIDQLRIPAKAKPILVIGFDAVGAFGNDDVLRTKVAPLFAQYGIRSYVTFTNVFDLVYSGGDGWDRMASLQNTYKWDAIPHTWNHGATVIGRNVTLSSLVFASDVGTATFANAHGIPLGTVFKAQIRGGSIAAGDILGEFTATTTTAATYTAAGAGTGTSTGTVKLNTMLSEVIASDTTENRRLALAELKVNADSMRGTGFARGVPYAAYPNNSVMSLPVLEYAAGVAGIRLGRATRGGYCFVDELGIDNPLNFGSFVMDSGTTLATRTSFIQGKVAGAVTRGAHIHIYGHFILDDEDPANAAYLPVAPDYPPGQNGNPAPPGGAALSGTGGWWYMSQLRDLIEDTVGPLVRSGQMLVMSPSEYAAFMGYTR
jgi:hypothetical protein